MRPAPSQRRRSTRSSNWISLLHLNDFSGITTNVIENKQFTTCVAAAKFAVCMVSVARLNVLDEFYRRCDDKSFCVCDPDIVNACTRRVTCSYSVFLCILYWLQLTRRTLTFSVAGCDHISLLTEMTVQTAFVLNEMSENDGNATQSAHKQ